MWNFTFRIYNERYDRWLKTHLWGVDSLEEVHVGLHAAEETVDKTMTDRETKEQVGELRVLQPNGYRL